MQEYGCLAATPHPDHAEHFAWVADRTASYAPFDPAFLEITAENRALAEQFWPREFGKHQAWWQETALLLENR